MKKSCVVFSTLVFNTVTGSKANLLQQLYVLYFMGPSSVAKVTIC